LPVSDPRPIGSLDRSGPWQGIDVVVAGFGRAGFAAADNLNHLGASVMALDTITEEEDPGRDEKAELLDVLGASVVLGPEATLGLPDHADLLIASPEFPDDARLLVEARARNVPIWGEVELAWRLRDPDAAAPWLVVAGGNGVAEVALLTERILLAGGLRPAVAGVVGLPLVEAVMDPTAYDALIVALDDTQLRDLASMSPLASVVLDGGEPLRGIVYENTQVACIYFAADTTTPSTEQLVREADVLEGARAIGITLGTPGVGMLGVVEDLLVERAFIPQRSTSAAELCALSDLPSHTPIEVTRALAAAALALALGVPPGAVRDGLRGA
jgi:UDP-N-acetylmuramoylalanine--D-glutamate ligase